MSRNCHGAWTVGLGLRGGIASWQFSANSFQERDARVSILLVLDSWEPCEWHHGWTKWVRYD